MVWEVFHRAAKLEELGNLSLYPLPVYSSMEGVPPGKTLPSG